VRLPEGATYGALETRSGAENTMNAMHQTLSAIETLTPAVQLDIK